MDPVISAEELLAIRDRVVIVDAQSGPDADTRYQVRHLAGAVHVDLDLDLAEKPADPAHGGRHPLPDVERFARTLGLLSIDPSSHVVVYDDKNGSNAAARFWWMLRALGHERVQVLDGGLAAGIAAGLPTDAGREAQTAKPPYPSTGWELGIALADEVGVAGHDPARLVIDVRDAVRYRGEIEPFDPNPGHVPGAINVPFASNLGPDGRFLTAEELAAKYRALLGDRAPEQVIVHCGSGVTACHTLLAMERAGIRGPKLYVGSWSEWGRSGRPIAKGGDPG